MLCPFSISTSLLEIIMKNVVLSLSLLALGVTAFADNAISSAGANTPHKAVTVWWVIFNAPDKCHGNPGPGANCTGLDLFGPAFVESMENGAPDPALIAPNLDAKPAVIYATGAVTRANGRIRFAASIYKSPADTQLTMPSGIDPMGFGRTYENEDAEIHLVVRDHGKAVPGQALVQITSFLDPYCSDPNLLYFSGDNLCVDTQFAVFGPQDSGDAPVYAFSDMQAVDGAHATLLRHGNVVQAVIETRVH
jgi:hypothetical protein